MIKVLNNKFRDGFKEFNSLDNLKKLDANKSGKIDLKEIKKAVEIYDDLLMIFPDYSMAVYNLASIHFQLNRKDRASNLFQKYLEMPKHISEYNFVKIAKRKLRE